MKFKNHVVRIIAAFIIFLCVTVSTAFAQPVPGFSKTAPLSGTGTAANPLKLNVCGTGSGYVSDGTSMVCSPISGGSISGLTTGTLPKATSSSTIGDSAFADNGSSLMTLTGRTLFVPGRSGANSISSRNSNGAQTGTTSLYEAQATGTYNTTSGALASYGANVTVSSTISSGANPLTNYGIWSSASGGTTNYSFWGNAGILNNVGAITENGARVFSITGTGLTSSGATVSLNMTPQTCGAGSHINSASAVGVFTCTTDAAGVTNSAGANVVTKSNGTNIVASAATDNGTTFTIGETTVINGNTTITGTGVGNSVAQTVQLTAAAATGDENLNYFHSTGTLDATAAVRNSYGAYSDVKTTRSAGANNVTNYGFFADVSGAQANYSFYGLNGILNNQGAITENGARVFSITGTGLTSSGATVSLNMTPATCGAGSAVVTVTATGGHTCGAIVVTGGVTGTGTSGTSSRWTGTSAIGNGALSDNGTQLGLGVAASSTYQLQSTKALAGANGTGIKLAVTGGALTGKNVALEVSASGGSNASDYAIDATSGHVNIATGYTYRINGSLASAIVCTTSGNVPTWNGSAWTCLTPYGGYIGAANRLTKTDSGASGPTDSLLTDNATTLSYNGGLFTVTASTGTVATSGNVSATGSVSAGGQIFTNQYFQTNTAGAGHGYYAGPNSDVYLSTGIPAANTGSLNCAYSVAGAATCYINPVGASEGTTQARSLEIDDGQGTGAAHAVATFGAAGGVGIGQKTGATAGVTIGSSTNPINLSGVTTVNLDAKLASSVRLLVKGNTPTTSTCGTGATITGDNTAMLLTLGTGTVSPCVITFPVTFTNEPVCTVETESSTKTFSYSKTATALTLTSGTVSAKYDIICVGIY